MVKTILKLHFCSGKVFFITLTHCDVRIGLTKAEIEQRKGLDKILLRKVLQTPVSVPTVDVEIVVYPGILVPRKYFSWQKIFGKVTMLNRKIDYNVR